MVIKHDGHLFLLIGQALEANQFKQAGHESIDIFHDLFFEVVGLAVIGIDKLFFCCQRGRFNETGDLGNGDRPGYLVATYADGACPPLIKGDLKEIDGVNNGDLQLVKGCSQLRGQGRVKFQGKGEDQIDPGLSLFIQQKLFNSLLIPAKTRQHIKAFML